MRSCVEPEEGNSLRGRRSFEGAHQLPPDALPLCVAADHDARDLRPVARVRRPRALELRGADEFLVDERAEEQPLARLERADHLREGALGVDRRELAERHPRVDRLAEQRGQLARPRPRLVRLELPDLEAAQASKVERVVAPASRAFRRNTAFVCSCETRDSVTPSTSPISRSVSSS